MDPQYIIVQAGGKGTRMEQLTRNKPKALVPVNNLPMLFHLFRRYPDKTFIVIGDYKYTVLERYLETFAEVRYELVSAAGMTGTCAGIGKALSVLPAEVSFMLIWSDLVLPESFSFPESIGNYVGIAKDFPCRWKYEHGSFTEERSEDFGVAGLFLFEEKSALKDIPEQGEFVRWLKGQALPLQSLDLYQTKEYGLLSQYQKQAEGTKRCRPFNSITVAEGTVIKEAIDEQGRILAQRERCWYDYVMKHSFPYIPQIKSLDPLKMEYVKGKNLYEYPDTELEEKRKMLSTTIEALKKLHGMGEIPCDPISFEDAYIVKTFERLRKVEHLIPFAQDEEIVINGRRCRNVYFHWEDLRKAVMQYLPPHFQFIHGDCTFSNMLLRENGSPVLIDPRGYFGRTELYGDPAYDWAKLYYSITGNYDQFNLKKFTLEIGRSEVTLRIDSNHWENMEETFFSLLGSEVDRRQIKLYHAIIWLSLTTYAWEDYDSICGAFYNGLYYLEDVL
jgi:GTP:adenosylcobinamide-phosphate guanylyltransferase/thiamine kinase-like enzyme